MKKHSASWILAALCLVALTQPAWSAGRQLVFAQGMDIYALDPGNAKGTGTASVVFHLFNALTKTTPDGQVVGDLALSYRAVNDTTWEFKLKKGVKFHNGEPFNAQSVKFSVERTQDPTLKMTLASDFSFIKEVKIIDDYTVHLITKTPFMGTPLRMFYLAMVPPKYIAEKGDAEFGKNPIGTGPFKFVEWKKGAQIVMDANKEYFEGAPAVDRVIYKIIPDDASRVAALEAGDVDLIAGVPTSQVARLSKNPSISVVSAPTTRVMFIGINATVPGPLQDKRVRQALNYAVDVDSIIKNVLDGYGIRLSTISTPEYFGYAAGVAPYTRDVAKAKQLLKDAGYEKGFAITFSVSPGSYLNGKDVVEVLAAQLKEVGVIATVVEKEAALMSTEMASKKIDPLFLNGIGGPYADLELIARIAFGTGERYSTFVNKDFDALREKASSTIDEAKSKALWKQLQEMAREEAPAIFLYQQFSVYAYNKKLVDWKPRLDQLIITYGAKFSGKK